MIESRYNRLMALYWKALYTAHDERQLAKPSEAVLVACEMVKKVINEEIKRENYMSRMDYTAGDD